MTAKPVVYVCNVEEASAASGNDYSRKVEARAKEEGAVAVVISAKIESEIAVLSREEREDYLAAVGLKEAGLDRLIRAGYALLDLVTYFTVGPKEARAWTITRGTKAPQAAAVIHTDFETRLHPRRDHRLRRLCRVQRRSRRDARPESSASKARNTSSPTATCCISASRRKARALHRQSRLSRQPRHT